MFVKPEKTPNIPTSYILISLLPYFSKICERLIIFKRLLSPHIFAKNIFLASKFGF